MKTAFPSRETRTGRQHALSQARLIAVTIARGLTTKMFSFESASDHILNRRGGGLNKTGKEGGN